MFLKIWKKSSIVDGLYQEVDNHPCFYYIEVDETFELKKNGKKDQVIFELKDELTQQEIETVPLIKDFKDGKIKNKYTEEECQTFELDEIKKNLCKKIDLVTSKRIFEGFEFDDNIFSLSIHAQNNWNTMSQWYRDGLKDNDGNEIKKLEISTKDDTIYLIDKENIPVFCALAIEVVQGILTWCRNERVKVKQFETIEEIINYQSSFDAEYSKYIW